jgi:outer membrane protein
MSARTWIARVLGGRPVSGFEVSGISTHDLVWALGSFTAMEHQLEEVSHGYQAGTRAVTDVDDTKARLGTARAQLVAARNDFENAQGDLERIIGAEATRPKSLAELPASLRLPTPIPGAAEDWIAQARDSSPKVVAQRAALEAARYDVERARSGHLPTVDLIVTTGRNFSNHSLTTPDDYSTRAVQHEVAVQVNVPLFAGGAVVARVSEAESGLEKARADLDAAGRDAADDARHAFNGVLSGLAQVDALQAAEAAGESALKGNQAGFRVGYRTNVDVLNAQQQLYAARRDLSKARYDVLLQGLRLKAAVGSLSENDLAAIDSLLR